MPLIGRVKLPLLIGTVGIVAYTYVFEKLGAEFLLGVNAIHENGLVIDGAEGRLHQKSSGQGVALQMNSDTPIREFVCTTCEHEEDCKTESSIELTFTSGLFHLQVGTQICSCLLYTSPSPRD